MCNADTSYLFCFLILFSYLTSLSQRLHYEIWSIARDLAQSYMIEGVHERYVSHGTSFKSLRHPRQNYITLDLNYVKERILNKRTKFV